MSVRMCGAHCVFYALSTYIHNSLNKYILIEFNSRVAPLVIPPLHPSNFSPSSLSIRWKPSKQWTTTDWSENILVRVCRSFRLFIRLPFIFIFARKYINEGWQSWVCYVHCTMKARKSHLVQIKDEYLIFCPRFLIENWINYILRSISLYTYKPKSKCVVVYTMKHEPWWYEYSIRATLPISAILSKFIIIILYIIGKARKRQVHFLCVQLWCVIMLIRWSFFHFKQSLFYIFMYWLKSH